MKKLLIAFIFSLIAIPVKAETVCSFGTKFDCYGGSVYIASSTEEAKAYFAIGQFRDGFKIELGAESNRGLGLKIIGTNKGSFISPYLNYDLMEVGFYTDFNGYTYNSFSQLYALYGVDFEFIGNFNFVSTIEQRGSKIR